uniref:Putative secreted protein n=1 Tax=Ixodes ricinus TaxID=34613 RepID=A0A6B0TTS6_IXORI
MFMFCVYKSLFLPMVIEALYTLHISTESAQCVLLPYFSQNRKNSLWLRRKRKKKRLLQTHTFLTTINTSQNSVLR